MNVRKRLSAVLAMLSILLVTRSQAIAGGIDQAVNTALQPVADLLVAVVFFKLQGEVNLRSWI